ncbi:LOW QUALITY PROTEIN: putative vomeronasal receptor-like protein 4 [Ctenodactylus gundi]
MTGSNIIRRIIFLSLIVPGIAGNFFLFVKHVCTSVTNLEKKSTDFILIQLAFTNMVTLFTSGIPDMRSPIHPNNFLDTVGCKTVVYVGRVARGLSICTTFLLSLVHAVTISPRTTLGRLKPRTAWRVLPCLLFFWIFNLLISSNLLHYMTAVSSVNRTVIERLLGHCYMLPSRPIVKWLFLSLMTLRDVIFQSLMVWSSGYMALSLYKHHRRVLYLHSSRSSNNSSQEIRATLSTLILMICFLFFYWADFMISFYIGSIVAYNSVVVNIKLFLGVGYASLSPFVLISRGVHMVKCWYRR